MDLHKCEICLYLSLFLFSLETAGALLGSLFLRFVFSNIIESSRDTLLLKFLLVLKKSNSHPSSKMRSKYIKNF